MKNHYGKVLGLQMFGSLVNLVVTFKGKNKTGVLEAELRNSITF